MLCIIVTSLLIFTNSAVANDPFTYIDDNINTLVKFEENATLHCNDSNSDIQFQFWIRPDATVMKSGYFEEFRILDNYAGWIVSQSGLKLHIIHVQERHFGIYTCVYKTGSSDEVFASKKGLNANGPYFGNFWDLYRMNTIIGGSAAGGFLVLSIIIATIHHFVEQRRKPNERVPAVLGSNHEEAPKALSSISYPLKTPEAPTVSGRYYDNIASKGVELIDTTPL